MNNKRLEKIVILSALASVLLFPVLHLGIVIVNLTISILVLGLQAVLIRLPRQPVERRSLGGTRPFVSIHVPAHNEPPELLKATLKSLSELDWPNYEVMVIDNNTTDESLWKPIEEYCRQLGPQFRFFHVENLSGFKAGAMNYIRRFMNPRTNYVFVVDADYVVERDAIQRGLSYFSDVHIGLVQFPQNYRNTCDANLGITLDFKHFFSGYMMMANRLDCVPSTGTLSFLRIEALRAVEGFETEVITEDADLGLRLGMAGYRAVYAHENIGQGVMPHDLPSLKKQRWRWAFGNAQILKLNWRSMWLKPGLSLKQRLGFFAHLTAWFNFNLIPSLSLIALIPFILLDRVHEHHPWIVLFSGLTFLIWLLLRFSVLFYSLRRDGHTLTEIWRAYAAHVGMGWIYSSSWIKCLVDHRSPFVRTNKFLTNHVPDVLKSTFMEAMLAAGFFVSCGLLALEGFIIAPLAALLLGTTRLLIFWIWRQMRSTLEMSLALEATDSAQDGLDASLADGLELSLIDQRAGGQ